MKLVELSVEIAAPPSTVYEWLTRSDLLATWMDAQPGAIVEPAPGGRIRWTHQNGDSCAGYFVDLVPYSRVSFTYGWERPEIGVPEGSTLVEFTLHATPSGTRLALVQRGLSQEAANGHAVGWAYYTGRLQSAVTGTDPGPDIYTVLLPSFAPAFAGTTPAEWYDWCANVLTTLPAVERSTMMGFPCLRRSGAFFASLEPKAGRLIVKLPAGRVRELLDSGIGQPFAPAGRTFREWVAVSEAHAPQWLALASEACLAAPAITPERPRRTKR